MTVKNQMSEQEEKFASDIFADIRSSLMVALIQEHYGHISFGEHGKVLHSKCKNSVAGWNIFKLPNAGIDPNNYLGYGIGHINFGYRLTVAEKGNEMHTPFFDVGLDKHGNIRTIETCKYLPDFQENGEKNRKRHSKKLPSVFIYDELGNPMEVKYFLNDDEYSREMHTEIINSPLYKIAQGARQKEVNMPQFMKRTTSEIQNEIDKTKGQSKPEKSV